MKQLVLIVEDNPDIAMVLSTQASELGLQMTIVGDGERGLEEALSGKYALVVLDISLPKLNGLDVCREIRRHNETLPVLMLTSRSEEVDRVLGLELGADDYVTKPFSVPEVVARIRALLRRSRFSHVPTAAATHETPTVEAKDFGEVTVDVDMRRVTVKGNPVALTALEFQLLELLVSRPGKVFSRESIIEALWGEYFANIEPSLTRVVSRLRAKIEPDTLEPRYVQTVIGVGYKWEP